MPASRSIPAYDRQQARKSLNAQVEERPSFRIVAARDRHAPRLGTKLASCLLILELSMVRSLDGYDVEWFEGELLRRLREHYAAAGVTEGELGTFDLWAGMYDYEGTDGECVMKLGKRRFQQCLMDILSGLYREEGATGDITALALRGLHMRWEGHARSTKRGNGNRRQREG